MKSLFILIILVSFLILPSLGEIQTNQSANVQDIQVGAILPLDGRWGSPGKDSEVALNLAMDTLNDYLKSDSLKIVLHIENSSSEPEKALDALKKFHAEGIRTVIGPMSSAEASALTPYANENDMLLLSPSSTAISLALNDNLYRLVPNDNNQADALAQLIHRQNITQILVVYLNDEYGSGMDNSLREKASDPKSGFQVIGSVPFDPSLTHYDLLVQNITSAATELQSDSGAVVLIGSGSNAVGIFTSAGLQSPLIQYKWFSGDGVIHEAEILNNRTASDFAVKTRLEGFTLACEDTVTIVPTMMAAGLMSNELGMAPAATSLPVWDAIWIIAKIYQSNPNANNEQIKSSLRSISKKSGNVFNEIIEFDPNGDIIFGKYARFMAVKDETGKVSWKLVGMFIKNKTVGAFITDATNTITNQSGNISIGAVLPMTGANAEIGKGNKEAINLAISHANSYYNKTQGLDIHFSFDIRDSESDPTTTLSQVKALHDKGINLIILGGISAELAAVKEYVRDNNIIVISPRSTAISLSDPDNLIFRLSPNDTHQAKAMAYLLKKQGKRHLVVIYRDDIYGQDFEKSLLEQFNGTANNFKYSVNESDFFPLLENVKSAIKNSNPQDTAVVVIGTQEVIHLLETVEDGPLTSVSWYGTDGIAQSRGLLLSPKQCLFQ